MQVTKVYCWVNVDAYPLGFIILVMFPQHFVNDSFNINAIHILILSSITNILI